VPARELQRVAIGTLAPRAPQPADDLADPAAAGRQTTLFGRRT
jgi:hypothetical protein